MKRSRALTLIAIGLALTLAIFWIVSTSRLATETAEYKVVSKIGDVEIRDYTRLALVSTSMSDGETDRSFGKLFRFITGRNEQSEKIAMTTPVLIDTANEKKTMSFILSKRAVEKGVPKPTEESVSLGEIDADRFAVLRFPGVRSEENEAKAIGKLRSWLEGQKLHGLGAPIFAYYDPPWTPTFLRRNEVMIRIERHSGSHSAAAATLR